MRSTIRFALTGLLLFVAGCGPGETGFTGTVTLDGKNLPDAIVSLHPTEDTDGLGGFGRTDSAGKFKIVPRRSRIAPGEYRVVISRRLRPDGSLPDPDIPPIESDAVESLPPEYSDLERTTLKVTVPAAGKGDFPLVLQSKP